MDDLKKIPVDTVVLAWLVLPRTRRSTADLAKAIAPLLGVSADDSKAVANDTLGRLKARGLIERDTRLMLTEAGRMRALAVLDIAELPKRVKADWNWAKKILVLRALDLPVTAATINKTGEAGWLAKSLLIRHHRLSLQDDASAGDILAALAWRAMGQDHLGSFTLKNLFGRPMLAGAPAAGDEPSPGVEPPATPRLPDDLPRFAASVREAAQATSTGRWHDNKVFISHVWQELRRRFDGPMTFAEFQRRLIEANRAQLIELSRADLVQAMPAEDVAASETPYLNATFHFVRLDDR